MQYFFVSFDALHFDSAQNNVMPWETVPPLSPQKVGM